MHTAQYIMSISTRITFSHLYRVIKNAGIKTNVPLGRWGIRNETNRGLVVDYSNEDHCGTCGDYIQQKQTTLFYHPNSNLDNDYNRCLELEYISITCNLPN
mgnify:CR=1 FL=1